LFCFSTDCVCVCVCVCVCGHSFGELHVELIDGILNAN
jgi:malonyl CoA-acyl carrier protein transacylase